MGPSKKKASAVAAEKQKEKLKEKKKSKKQETSSSESSEVRAVSLRRLGWRRHAHVHALWGSRRVFVCLFAAASG